MIAVKLMGGLGNQMFQYALGRKISFTKGVELALDLTFYNDQAAVDTPRHYELDCFNIYPKLITTPIANVKPKFSIFNKTPYFANRYLEKQFSFNQEVLNQPDNTLFQGYWQTDKYFIDIRNQLLKDFTLKEPLSSNDQMIANSIYAQTSVSLHIRRGDYVDNANVKKYHGLIGTDYSIEAVKIMNEKVGKYKLFVFSDDITWCKENLINIHNDITFVDGARDGCIDMNLMKLCKHNIIANSSFSWWGAWLNNNSNKVVVAPKIWFNNKTKDTSDIIPQSWLKI